MEEMAGATNELVIWSLDWSELENWQTGRAAGRIGGNACKDAYILLIGNPPPAMCRCDGLAAVVTHHSPFGVFGPFSSLENLIVSVNVKGKFNFSF